MAKAEQIAARVAADVLADFDQDGQHQLFELSRRFDVSPKAAKLGRAIDDAVSDAPAWTLLLLTRPDNMCEPTNPFLT